MRRDRWIVGAIGLLLMVSAAGGTEAWAQGCDDPIPQLYGMNIDPWNGAGNPSAAELQTAGVRWVRIEFKEGPGFAFFDPVLAALRGAGIKVLLLVDYASFSNGGQGSPGVNGSDPAWDTYIAGFTSAVDAIATHYGDGVDAWQIWNEPDLTACGAGYDPCVPAHKYGPMLCSAQGAITLHSSRAVVTGGLASGNPGFLSNAITAAGSLCADAVAVHPYGQRAPDDWPNVTWGFGNMSDLFAGYLQFGVPLWVSEVGTVDQANQAQYLTNVYDLVRSNYLGAGQVVRVFWFCWSDGMVSPHGILDGSGSPKASYYSYQSSAPAWDAACGGTGPTDGDGDGFAPPADCDDGNPNVHPGATEVCGNGVDEDCSGADLPCGTEAWFSYVPSTPHALQSVEISIWAHQGYTNVGLSITGPSGAVAATLTGIDGACVGTPSLLCRWTYAAVFPDAGTYAITFTADPGASTVYGADTLTITGAPGSDQDGDGYDATADCDDTNPSVHPGAPELCDNDIDEDCDGQDAPCTADGDGDGYPPPGDCDDAKASVHPGAVEVCGNGVDEDCSGQDEPCTQPPDAGVVVVDGGAPQGDAGPSRDGGGDATLEADGGDATSRRVAGGCGCRAAGAGAGRGGLLFWLWIAGLLLVWRRRRALFL